jgi:hypothetical protein
MSTKSIPDGYDSLIPTLIVRDAAKASKAVGQGAKGMMPPMDMFWGDRYGKFIDPFGHLWGVATHKKDVTPEEMAQGAAAWGKANPA